VLFEGEGLVLAAEAAMSVRELFQNVVVPDYNDFVQSPTDFRLLKSALLSMDTVPERLALHQLGYPQLSRKELNQEAQKIRRQFNSLKDLHSCSNYIVRRCRQRNSGLVIEKR
jgi:hypothetical protein